MTDPADAHKRAQLEALQAVAELHDTADGPAEIAPGEQEIIAEFAEKMARALVAGLPENNTSVSASALSDAAKYYNKTDVQAAIQDAVEDLDESGKTPFDELIREELEGVKVVRSTDRKQDTLYRWNFRKCQLETHSGGEGREHFHWSNFRDSYLEACGEDAGQPNKSVRGGREWRDFIVDVIQERGTEVTTRGPRTAAVEDLGNEIRTTTGYNNIQDAVERDGIYVELPQYDVPDWWGAGQPFGYERPPVEDVPDWWGGLSRGVDFAPPKWYGNGTAHLRCSIDLDPEVVEEVRVPNHIIKRVCNANELSSTRALQVELDGRGYTVNRIPGVSEAKKVAGRKVSFWVLSPDLAVPQVYDNSPDSVVDAIDRSVESETSPATNGSDTPGEAIDFVGGGE